jgi:hypothetical protein
MRPIVIAASLPVNWVDYDEYTGLSSRFSR